MQYTKIVCPFLSPLLLLVYFSHYSYQLKIIISFDKIMLPSEPNFWCLPCRSFHWCWSLSSFECPLHFLKTIPFLTYLFLHFYSNQLMKIKHVANHLSSSNSMPFLLNTWQFLHILKSHSNQGHTGSKLSLFQIKS